ncbi:MAG: PDR/VanB family oxidoreductase [Nocardioides sp.]|uniref:PDR/VanB family oxidoreductase n=1 Tax=Nocardioides sp. TaxID=35761 RepID=UPI0039E507DE
MTSKRDYTVRGLRLEAEGVLSVELVPADGGMPPAWEPGAHIDVVVGDGTVRQYSLCGEPGDDALRVAVLREPAGRGGSHWIHDRLRPGDRVAVGGPRNHFALRPAPSYLFVAGGIGITPLLPMIRAVDGSGLDWRLHYYGRLTATMAFRGELAAYGDRVALHPAGPAVRPEPGTLLANVGEEALIYACGPARLVEALAGAATCRGCCGRFLTELFAAPEDQAPRERGAFTLRLERSGTEVEVPADRSALSVLTDAGVDILRDCEEGICGSCETRVLAGAVDHRDHVLTAQERAANDCMMLCVSRAAGARLVLDL